MITRSQKSIALLISGTFVFGFFFIYPGLVIFKLFNEPTDPRLIILDKGLRHSYKSGDNLTFTMTLEGYWEYDGIHNPTMTTMTKIAELDRISTNETIWEGTGIVRTPPEYANTTGILIKEIYIGGPQERQIHLAKTGIYELNTVGDNMKPAKRHFTVTDS